MSLTYFGHVARCYAAGICPLKYEHFVATVENILTEQDNERWIMENEWMEDPYEFEY